MDSWDAWQDVLCVDTDDEIEASTDSDANYDDAFCKVMTSASCEPDPGEDSDQEEEIDEERLTEVRVLFGPEAEEAYLKELKEARRARATSTEEVSFSTCVGETKDGVHTPCCFGKNGGPAAMDQPELFPTRDSTCIWCMPDIIAKRIDELGPRMEIFKAFKAVEEHFPVNIDARYMEEPLLGSLLVAANRIPEKWREFFGRVIFYRRNSIANGWWTAGMKKRCCRWLVRDWETSQEEEEEDQRKEAEMEKNWAAKEAAEEAKAAKELTAKKRPAKFVDECGGNGTDPCIFSRTRPGKPAEGHSGTCMFCDADRLPLFAQTRNGKIELKKALACFQEHCLVAHERAMQLVQALPEEARNDILEKDKWCRGRGKVPCVFSREKPGQKARALPNENTCLWCNPSKLRDAEQTPATRRRLQQSLNAFRKNERVFELAMSKLSATCKKALAASRAQTQQQTKYRANAAKKRMSRG